MLQSVFKEVYSSSFTVVKLFTTRKVRKKKWIRNIKNNCQYYISFDKLFSRAVNTEPFQSAAKSKLLEISFCYFHNSGLCSNYFVSQTFNKRVTYAIFCLAWRIVRLSVRRLQLLNYKGDKYANRHINTRISSRCVATYDLFSKQNLYWLFTMAFLISFVVFSCHIQIIWSGKENKYIYIFS